jgi:hypothetical protein
MGLLAGVHYDPSTAVAKSTASLLAMTAFDTTNLRLNFTAPTNGTVLVKIRCQAMDQNQSPSILLGVLEGATVMGRQRPIGALNGTAVSTTRIPQEAVFLVTGLSAGSHTFDAAYAVQVILTSTNIRYGGPNDTTSNNAYGGFSFEIYDTPNLLAGKNYDPSTAVSASTASLLAMTALDTTNLRLTFAAPTSGTVMVRLRTCVVGAIAYPQIILGVLDGATVKGRGIPMGGLATAANTTLPLTLESQFLVTGLTPTTSYTYDAAYGVELVVASTNLKYGGPNTTTGNDAWGSFAYDIWSV